VSVDELALSKELLSNLNEIKTGRFDSPCFFIFIPLFVTVRSPSQDSEKSEEWKFRFILFIKF